MHTDISVILKHSTHFPVFKRTMSFFCENMAFFLIMFSDLNHFPIIIVKNAISDTPTKVASRNGKFLIVGDE